jgi:hypothetical protein
VVIAYLMKHHAMSYMDALTFVKEKRKIVSPNRRFATDLRDTWSQVISLCQSDKNEASRQKSQQESETSESNTSVVSDGMIDHSSDLHTKAISSDNISNSGGIANITFDNHDHDAMDNNNGIAIDITNGIAKDHSSITITTDSSSDAI